MPGKENRQLVATVSEFLTVGFSDTCIPNSKRLNLGGSSRFCKEEPAVRKALTAATSSWPHLHTGRLLAQMRMPSLGVTSS